MSKKCVNLLKMCENSLKMRMLKNGNVALWCEFPV